MDIAHRQTDSDPILWESGTGWTFHQEGRLQLMARVNRSDCNDRGPAFQFTYEVVSQYPPAALKPGSSAIHKDDPRFRHWASTVESYQVGAAVTETWQVAENALGEAVGSSADVVSLGPGGTIVLGFDSPITNTGGADFAVFENSFNDTFLELAYVEVSTDGVLFLRFDSAYLGAEPVGAFGAVSPENINGLAGKYRASYGVPFDLSDLENRQAVRAGRVDLMNIRFVKLVDVVGDGSAVDSFGHPIYDPTHSLSSS